MAGNRGVVVSMVAWDVPGPWIIMSRVDGNRGTKCRPVMAVVWVLVISTKILL